MCLLDRKKHFLFRRLPCCLLHCKDRWKVTYGTRKSELQKLLHLFDCAPNAFLIPLVPNLRPSLSGYSSWEELLETLSRTSNCLCNFGSLIVRTVPQVYHKRNSITRTVCTFVTSPYTPRSITQTENPLSDQFVLDKQEKLHRKERFELVKNLIRLPSEYWTEYWSAELSSELELNIPNIGFNFAIKRRIQTSAEFQLSDSGRIVNISPSDCPLDFYRSNFDFFEW